MKTLENASEALENIALGILELPQSDHLGIVNSKTGQALDVETVEALVFEGMLNGSATELYQAGLGDVVDGITHRHGIILERSSDGEG